MEKDGEVRLSQICFESSWEDRTIFKKKWISGKLKVNFAIAAQIKKNLNITLKLKCTKFHWVMKLRRKFCQLHG